MTVVPGWVWIVWSGVLLASFGVLEGLALTNKRHGDTLSERLRAVLGIDPPRPWRRIGVASFVGVLLGFVAWFVPHILYDWPF